MGSMSPIHWLLVIGIAVILFGGRGKLSGVMGDFAKGIKAFKSGMKEPDEEPATPPAQVSSPAGATASVGVGERSRDHA
jgi:sec-independent protein translocase protein TatA